MTIPTDSKAGDSASSEPIDNGIIDFSQQKAATDCGSDVQGAYK